MQVKIRSNQSTTHVYNHLWHHHIFHWPVFFLLLYIFFQIYRYSFSFIAQTWKQKQKRFRIKIIKINNKLTLIHSPNTYKSNTIYLHEPIVLQKTISKANQSKSVIATTKLQHVKETKMKIDQDVKMARSRTNELRTTSNNLRSQIRKQKENFLGQSLDVRHTFVNIFLSHYLTIVIHLQSIWLNFIFHFFFFLLFSNLFVFVCIFWFTFKYI